MEKHPAMYGCSGQRFFPQWKFSSLMPPPLPPSPGHWLTSADPSQGGCAADVEVVHDWEAFASRHPDTFQITAVGQKLMLSLLPKPSGALLACLTIPPPLLCLQKVAWAWLIRTPPPQKTGQLGQSLPGLSLVRHLEMEIPQTPPPPGSDHMTVMGKSITRPRNAAKLANFGKVGHFG